MKKFMALMLVLILALSLLTACGGNNDNSGNNGGGKGTPSAPQNLTATAGNGEVTLSWDAPANNGGSEITGYEVFIEGGAPSVTKDTSYTFGALDNSVEYTFIVRAVNANGSGAEAKKTAAPAGENGNNNGGDTADRLVSDKFSMKAPEGWDIKKKTNEYGDDEATNPDTGSFMQLTTVGWPSSSIKTAEEAVEKCFEVYGLGTPVNVKVGSYNAKRNENGTAYMIQDGSYKIAYITISRQSESDNAAIEAALASFKIN